MKVEMRTLDGMVAQGTWDEWRDYFWGKRAGALNEIERLNGIVSICNTGLACVEASHSETEEEPRG